LPGRLAFGRRELVVVGQHLELDAIDAAARIDLVGGEAQVVFKDLANVGHRTAQRIDHADLECLLGVGERVSSSNHQRIQRFLFHRISPAGSE